MNDLLKNEMNRKNDSIYSDEQLQKVYCGFYNRKIKRAIDFGLALFVTLAMSPVFLIVAICIAAETGFPVFYTPLRGGYKDKPFRIVKFRSMVKNADQIGGYTTALHDFRITRVGRFLRKTKLDELPQLFNIIKGEMSFVGPRPEALHYVEMFEGQEKYILQVRPGITDFSSLEFADMDAVVGDGDVDRFFVENILKRKNELRIRYVAELSFTTDIKIFCKTVVYVFSHFFNKRVR